MAEVKLRGQTAMITVEDAATNTDIPVGTLDNPFVGVPQDVQELRGTGDTRWVDLQQTEQAVTIGGDVATFELDAWEQMVGWDQAAEELDGSADVKTFNVMIMAEGADGAAKEITAGPAYRDNDTELGGSREEWWGMSLEFRARDITSIVNTSPTA
jgi:hypothetical protein